MKKNRFWILVFLILWVSSVTNFTVLGLHYISNKPEPEEVVGSRYINKLISVGFKVTDPDGHEIRAFDER